MSTKKGVVTTTKISPTTTMTTTRTTTTTTTTTSLVNFHNNFNPLDIRACTGTIDAIFYSWSKSFNYILFIYLFKMIYYDSYTLF